MLFEQMQPQESFSDQGYDERYELNVLIMFE